MGTLGCATHRRASHLGREGTVHLGELMLFAAPGARRPAPGGHALVFSAPHGSLLDTPQVVHIM